MPKVICKGIYTTRNRKSPAVLMLDVSVDMRLVSFPTKFPSSLLPVLSAVGLSGFAGSALVDASESSGVGEPGLLAEGVV